MSIDERRKPLNRPMACQAKVLGSRMVLAAEFSLRSAALRRPQVDAVS